MGQGDAEGKACGPSAGRKVGQAPDWSEYWAFARIRLGLTKREFFGLTPRLFAALRKEWMAQRRETLTMASLIRMDLINYSFCHPEKRVELEDLLPGDGPGRAEDGPRLTKKRRREIADAWRRFFKSGIAAQKTAQDK